MADPEETCPKQLVNTRLGKIKEELNQSASENDEDLSFLYEHVSDSLPYKNFLSELDSQLEGLPRDSFVSELMIHCNDNPGLVNKYRYYLADYARKYPDCPGTRLVNRRNSQKSTKANKLAEDCFVLYSFIDGTRTRDIYDVFTTPTDEDLDESFIPCAQPQNTQSMSDKLNPAVASLEAPDVTAILIKLQTDISHLLRQRQEDTCLLLDIKSTVVSASNTLMLIHSSVNGLRSSVGSAKDTSMVAKLESDIGSLSSTVAVLSKKVCDSNLSIASNNSISATPVKHAAPLTDSSMTKLVSPANRGKMFSTAERAKSFASVCLSAKTKDSTDSQPASMTENPAIVALHLHPEIRVLTLLLPQTVTYRQQGTLLMFIHLVILPA